MIEPICGCGHELHWHDDDHCYHKPCSCYLSRNEVADEIINVLQIRIIGLEQELKNKREVMDAYIKALRK